MQRRTPPPNGIHAEVVVAAVQMTLGPERERLGVAIRAGVREPDRRRDVGPRRQHVPIHFERRGQPSSGQRDDRAQPQRLGDDRAQVPLVVLGALERLRVAQEEVERPRQPGGSRLMAREQQRHQLVADLGVLELGRDQHREDVLARIGAPLGDLAIQHPVDLPPARVEPFERVGRALEPLLEQHGELQAGRRGVREEPGEVAAERGTPVAVGDAEHRTQDHLERDLLHVRVERERLAGRPRLDVLGDDLADRVLVRAHARAVERRQHQPPAGEVLAPFEQQQRARTEYRQQRDRPAGRQTMVGVAVERADRVGIRQHHHRRLEPEEAHAERVAEAAAARLHERDRPQQPVQRLPDRRFGRPGWERVHGHGSSAQAASGVATRKLKLSSRYRWTLSASWSA